MVQFDRALALASSIALAATGKVGVTPHDTYSSSIGVLGCTVDTNRVAYLPRAPDCDSLCWKFSQGGRSVFLLHVDQSGGAWDISYDAWNYLATGRPASEEPSTGGQINAEAHVVSMDQCAHLITSPDGRMGFIGVSPNFVNSCRASAPNSWVAKNFQLWNYANSCCSLGTNDKCDYDEATQGPALTCGKSKLGATTPVKTQVMNVIYGSGKQVACV